MEVARVEAAEEEMVVILEVGMAVTAVVAMVAAKRVEKEEVAAMMAAEETVMDRYSIHYSRIQAHAACAGSPEAGRVRRLHQRTQSSKHFGRRGAFAR